MYNSDKHFKRMLKGVEEENRRITRIYSFSLLIFGLMVVTPIIVIAIKLINGG